MTIRPAAADSEGKRTTHLGVVQTGRTTLAPRDSLRLADPYPLGESALRVLTAMVEALCPPAPAPRSAELVARVVLGARTLLRYMHPLVARGLSLGLLFLDWLPVLTLTSAFRLHRLDPRRASALFAGWAASRFAALRLLVQGARSLVLSVYFDQKEVHEALRYDPVSFQRERVRLRASLLKPVTAAAE